MEIYNVQYADLDSTFVRYRNKFFPETFHTRSKDLSHERVNSTRTNSFHLYRFPHLFPCADHDRPYLHNKGPISATNHVSDRGRGRGTTRERIQEPVLHDRKRRICFCFRCCCKRRTINRWPVEHRPKNDEGNDRTGRIWNGNIDSTIDENTFEEEMLENSENEGKNKKRGEVQGRAEFESVWKPTWKIIDRKKGYWIVNARSGWIWKKEISIL